jgi:predicted nuclease of predicted toxin-antitoxin system
MRLLLDQGLPRGCAPLLREMPGWDVQHVADIGLHTATDESLLHYGLAQQRIIITLDADFHALLMVRGMTQPSVVRVRQEGLAAHAMAMLLRAVLPTVAAPLAQGALVTLTDSDVRVHLL